MELTKTMIESCNSLVNYKVTKKIKEKGLNGCSFYDRDDELLYICGRYGAVRYSRPDESSVRAVDIRIGNRRWIDGLDSLFRQAYKKENYHDDDFEIVNLSELAAEISARKNTDAYKQMENKIVVEEKFHSKYNMELLLKAAKCIGTKEVIIHYPSTSIDPIIITGAYGDYSRTSLILPLRR